MPSSSHSQKPQAPAIEFDNVYRHFGEAEVLRGLSFQVQEGQIYAFLGRNGAGKTTALRILMGRLAAHHGDSRVLGVSSQNFGAKERGAIGYVTEGHQLYKELGVAQTLSFEAGTRKVFHKDFAKDALGRLGIGKSAQVWQLSRGQRAQLSLIITIASSPKVLVLDDPALGLDVVMRRDFLDAMIEFLSGKGTTVLFSSHLLTDVERIADRVGILHEGRLRVDAHLDELKSRIQLRTWSHANGAEPPLVPEIMRRQRVGRSFELSLLDATSDTARRLTETGGHLSEPAVPSLEDLFLNLTTEAQSAGLLSAMPEEN